MRRVNRRLTFTGVRLMVLAAAFFIGMAAAVPKSADPESLMRTVGQVSGGIDGGSVLS